MSTSLMGSVSLCKRARIESAPLHFRVKRKKLTIKLYICPQFLKLFVYNCFPFRVICLGPNKTRTIILKHFCNNSLIFPKKFWTLWLCHHILIDLTVMMNDWFLVVKNDISEVFLGHQMCRISSILTVLRMLHCTYFFFQFVNSRPFRF